MNRLTVFIVLLLGVVALWILSCSTPPVETKANADETETKVAQAGPPDEFACMVDSFYQNSLHYTTEGCVTGMKLMMAS